MVELLAPAGSREALMAAAASGANAVYLSGNMFGARAYAANFDEKGLQEAIDYAHLRGIQVHVTVNTIIDDSEVPAMQKYLQFLYEAGADAVLVQDLGTARLVRETVPQLPMHASTQMTVHNLDGVQVLEELGFSRVVLSRELTLEAIQHICRHAKAEIEVFVHGALCVCYSGQCLMSSMIGGRSGNRGRCAQPCRLPYDLVDETGKNLLEGTAGKYLLSPRDLNTWEMLPELLAAGVDSLKIEGRMKKPEYVAVAVGCYRHRIDSLAAGNAACDEADARALAQIFNRDFTTAYLHGFQGRNMMSDKRPNNRGLSLGRVQVADRGAGLVAVKLSEALAIGDKAEIWVKAGGRAVAEVQQLFILKATQSKKKAGKKQEHKDNFINQEMLIPAEKAAAGTVAVFAVSGKVFAGDRVFKVHDAALMSAARETYTSAAAGRKIPLQLQVQACLGKSFAITMTDAEGNQAWETADFKGEQAIKHPLTREKLAAQLNRLGNSIFCIQDLDIILDEGVMFPVSVINDTRRKCIEQLEQKRLDRHKAMQNRIREQAAQSVLTGIEQVQKQVRERKAAGAEHGQYKTKGKPTEITVVADSLEKAAAALTAGARRIVFGGENYTHRHVPIEEYKKAVELVHSQGGKLIFNTPRIIRDSDINAFHSWLGKIAAYEGDGINVHNIGSLQAARKLTALPLETDYSLIAYNGEALKHLQELGVSRAVLSPELNFTQIARLAKESPMPLECLAEGNLELMISEYCCTGSFLGNLGEGKCSMPCRADRKYFLRDRKNICFPLVMDQYCHSHVLNANRLSMLPHAMKFKALGIAALRIDGRYMTAERLQSTVQHYREFMSYDEELSQEQQARAEKLEGKGITRGHYFRGVL